MWLGILCSIWFSQVLCAETGSTALDSKIKHDPKLEHCYNSTYLHATSFSFERMSRLIDSRVSTLETQSKNYRICVRRAVEIHERFIAVGGQIAAGDPVLIPKLELHQYRTMSLAFKHAFKDIEKEIKMISPDSVSPYIAYLEAHDGSIAKLENSKYRSRIKQPIKKSDFEGLLKLKKNYQSAIDKVIIYRTEYMLAWENVVTLLRDQGERWPLRMNSDILRRIGVAIGQTKDCLNDAEAKLL